MTANSINVFLPSVRLLVWRPEETSVTAREVPLSEAVADISEGTQPQ